MAQEQRHGSGPAPEGDEPNEAAGQVRQGVDVSALDDILDDIDGVLESNAETFVKNFVQKGGQ